MGGVVLPDASTGHVLSSLARKLSRRAPRERSEQRGCKEGMRAPTMRSVDGGALFAPVPIAIGIDRSRKFIPGNKFGGGHWRSVAFRFALSYSLM
jgi:hypothetical protein